MPSRFRDFLNFRRNRGRILLDKPVRERHLLSALCSIMTNVCIIVALAMQQWAVAETEKCSKCTFGLTKVRCHKGMDSQSCKDYDMTEYYETSHEILISCVLSISVLTMISSVVATVISAGFPREKLEFLRHYAVFNIVSLLCIILVAGFWLAVINSLPVGEKEKYRGTVKFGYAFYIYICGGVFTLVATCLNLLLAKTAAERRRQYRDRFRNRVMASNNSTIQRVSTVSTSGTTSNTIINDDAAEDPPEYTEATTSFIEGLDPTDETIDNEGTTTSDTDPLVPPPPPYIP